MSPLAWVLLAALVFALLVIICGALLMRGGAALVRAEAEEAPPVTPTAPEPEPISVPRMGSADPVVRVRLLCGDECAVHHVLSIPVSHRRPVLVHAGSVYVASHYDAVKREWNYRWDRPA